MSKTDFNLAAIRAVVFDVDGVLSPSTVSMDDDGVPCRMVNIKDGYAMQHAVKQGLKLAIITGANTKSIVERYGALGVHDVFIGASAKLPVLKKWLADKGIDPAETAYCGDDIPDIQPMQHVGLAVAPADAAPEVKNIAKYITTASGGYGVARELIEQIMRAKGQWMHNADAFGW